VFLATSARPCFRVISAEDIEVVNLERVGFNLKNFDMAIIFKDFTKDVHRIDQIPVQNLDNIKQWLATLDIKYYEGKSNLNWKPLLRQIKAGPGRCCPTCHRHASRTLVS